jgi:hypothetical protein
MSEPFPAFPELRRLLDALCEESITAEQLRRLEEIVLAHPEAEAYYVQYMHLVADLSRHFAVLPSTPEKSLRNRVQAQRDKATARQRDTEPSGQRTKRRGLSRHARLSWPVRVALAASALAAGVLLVPGLWPRPEAGRPPVSGNPPAEPSDNTVAVLLRAPGAQWEDTGLPTRVGAPLPPGHLRLKSGLAHIEFYNGATVILEGPADLELISSTTASCARGKLRATVPSQAQGFTIRTPKLDLVDRGTEFGLRVGDGDQTEVHVFQGKVDLYHPGSEQPAAAKELTTGQGLRLDGPGGIRPIQPDPAAFRTAQYLDARLAEETRRRQRTWMEASTALRQDPRLLVYYTFQDEPAGSRTLLDQAGGRQQPRDGVIVGCRWGDGRWPGKKGLEFKQVSDRVRLHVPGEFEALTLMTWVRVDALPNQFQSLMMTEGWYEGGPHWHISSAGILELGVQGHNNRGGVHYYSPAVFTPERLGHWMHLAVVYDRDGDKKVAHYVDGQLLHEEPLKLDIGLRLGDADIGNWNVGSRRHNHPIRYFSGCMDEFLLFKRALGAEEIHRLYEQGRPPL